ncbi:MAG: hypothetical protein LBE33_10805 [Zoogloeaceae bacterium]|jgi:hypothetical protein|nr:hypothetical protein [Zoogloeaceae bacterium]
MTQQRDDTMTMDEAALPDEPHPLVQREKDISAFFGLVLALWPFSVTAMLFMVAPTRIPQHIVYWATFAYGPVFLLAFRLASRLKRRNAYSQAIRVWLWLCGSNVLLWLTSFALLLATN